jgi:hypothetical protein
MRLDPLGDYRDRDAHREAETTPGVLILRFGGPLFLARADRLDAAVAAAVAKAAAADEAPAETVATAAARGGAP